MLPADVANPDEVNEAARLVDRRLGRHRRLGEQRHGVGAVTGQADDPARLRARHAGELPGRGLRHAGGAGQHAAARPRRHRAGRARLPRTGASRCSRRTRRRSTRCWASPNRCAPSCCTTDSHVHVTIVDLPATNTPQFDWVKNRMARQPRPAPPIYQPEVAADAVFHAAHHPRPAGLTDVLLARTGYRGATAASGRPRGSQAAVATCGRRFAAITAHTGGSTATHARGACSCGPRCTGASCPRASRRWSRCRGSASAGPAAEQSR